LTQLFIEEYGRVLGLDNLEDLLPLLTLRDIEGAGLRTTIWLLWVCGRIASNTDWATKRGLPSPPVMVE
jgi:hypothetical protein